MLIKAKTFLNHDMVEKPNLTFCCVRILRSCSAKLSGAVSSVVWLPLLLLFLTFIACATGMAQTQQGTAEEVHTIYPSEWGAPYPAGVSYSLRHDHLAFVSKRDPAQSPADTTRIVVTTPYEDLVATVLIPFVVDHAINVAYAGGSSQLLLLNNAQAELAAIARGEDGSLDPSTLVRQSIAHLDLKRAQGMSVDSTSGQLFILDGDTSEILRVNLDNSLTLVSKIALSHIAGTNLRGVAIHPLSHHLFVANPLQGLLYELTQSGHLVNIYDLAALDLIDASGLAFGPSADLTDSLDIIHLFLADSNLPDGGSSQLFGRILEVRLRAGSSYNPQTVTVQAATSGDDSEETVATKATDVDSSDLELIQGENGDQIVGIRFGSLPVPANATILSASIELAADETESITTTLLFRGEATGNATPFMEPNSDISRRMLTAASVTWSNLPAWDLLHATYRTPDLSPIVQELVDHSDWKSGNAIAFIISGTGKRTAEAYEGEPTLAPRLVVEYVEISSTPTPTPSSVFTPIATPIATPTLVSSSVRFAIIGDFGRNNADEGRVADLVDSWDPDFVATTGDNNYPDGEAITMDDNIGQYYSQYIGNYQGVYGPGSPTNRFWPSLGNHDWHTMTCGDANCTGAYFDYFTLPNHERYYEVDLGLLHLFALDSESEEPDGRSVDSIQAEWLRTRLAASTACYQLVYFHRAPYSTGKHGSHPVMQWPFADWGADAVFSGHDHLYERLDVGGVPYFVNGAGGAPLYAFGNIDDLPPAATSVVRYNEDHGAMLVSANLTQIIYQFYSAAGHLIDDYTVPAHCIAPTPMPGPSPTPTVTATPSPSATPTSAATPTVNGTIPPTATPTGEVRSDPGGTSDNATRSNWQFLPTIFNRQH